MKEIIDIVITQIPVFLKLQEIIGGIIETVEQMTNTPEKKVIASLVTIISVWKLLLRIGKKINRRRRP